MRVLLCACVIAIAASAMADHGVPHVSLTIGVIDFNPASETDESRYVDPLIDAYLRHVTQRSTKVALHFDVVRGNYYQILRWMREGKIDGAVVSPFTYEVLASSSAPGQLPLPVVSLFGRSTVKPAGRADGNEPMLRASVGERRLPNADRKLLECTAALVDPRYPQCTFHFVSHLSTTGFIYPLVRMDEILYCLYGLRISDVADRLMERTRFKLWHKETGGAGIRLEFSYRSHVLDDPTWHRLMPSRYAFADDVLLLSGVTVRAGKLRASFDPAVWDPAGMTRPERLRDNVDIRPLDDAATELQAQLSRDVDGLFPDRNNHPLWKRWYLDGQYDFTVREVVDLLRNDQLLQSRKESAAIVLPGGGVRGAYQAQILDELYARHVVNQADAARAASARPLVIQSIVGTSGGALMGYFAARRAPNDGKALTDRWLVDGQPAITLSDVFPLAGAPRWLSVLTALALFALCAATFWSRNPQPAVAGVPLRLTLPLIVVLLAAPLMIFPLARIDRTVVPWGAGVAYVILIVFAHALHSVVAIGQPKQGRLVFGIGALMIGLATVLHVYLNPSDYPHNFQRELILAGLGLWLLVLAIFALAAWKGICPTTALLQAYGKAMAVLALFGAGTVILFAIGAAFEAVTSLELTGDYWLGLIGASLLSSAVLVWLASRQHAFGQFVDGGIDCWFRLSRRSPVFYNPILTLLLIGFGAFCGWLLFVAPAIYDGEAGASTFRLEARKAGKPRARFVAALTNLGTPVDAKTSALATGDYYAIESGYLYDNVLKDAPRILDWEGERFLDAVSASGSPFPIYPGRRLEHHKGTAVFVDGGYTHLVPVEGAILTGAKQVLIVSNAKRVSLNDRKIRLNPWSLLISDVGRTASFLFERAQHVDEAMQDDVMTASIAPEWLEDDPFLMDFRSNTIRNLVHEAWYDIRARRPGRVASWGQPTVFLIPRGATAAHDH